MNRLESSPPTAAVPSIPRAAGILAAVACGAVLVSALLGAAASVTHTPRVWFVLGFEVVTALAAGFGILLGFGRFREGPALGLTCVAGAIGVSALLGFIAGRGNMGADLRPFLIAREAGAAVIGACAAYTVLVRRPRASWPRLSAGLACAGAFAGVAVGAWMLGDRFASLGTVAGVVVGFLVSGLLLGLLAAAVHLLIGAFESGAVE